MACFACEFRLPMGAYSGEHGTKVIVWSAKVVRLIDFATAVLPISEPYLPYHAAQSVQHAPLFLCDLESVYVNVHLSQPNNYVHTQLHVHHRCGHCDVGGVH